MRVTNNTFPDTLLGHLQRVTKEMNTLNEQVATGQRISKVSEDSASANRILDMQEEKARISQYSKNASRAQNINNTTISQLQNFIQISDRVSELATLADGLSGEDGMKAYAEEVDELIEHAMQSANAKFNGEYIFAGVDTGNQPFQVLEMEDDDGNVFSRDLAAGTVTMTAPDGSSHTLDLATNAVTALDSSGSSVTPTLSADDLAFPDSGKILSVEYTGAESGSEFHLSETGTISPYTDGSTNEEFATFINRMIELRDAMETGEPDAVSGTLRTELEDSEDSLIFALSRQGSVQMRIEFDLSLNEQRFTDLEENISAEADVDIAQTVVKLTQVQNAYQASLKSAGQVLDQSLLDYL
ncbi:flagellar hook-associated protein FlgL [Pelagicoccus albus]|uniref:Flagellar hook-associated protein FlgL n=1 Tax=Pelagicoccus albus TaxID=415222 RepID=A0A7X1E898_9BACT|nr:flagellar hook-associated protein FlgL [Pelagicoccus albus]MBC2606036.1 flagellar hook-associated protein FlgL [Pelagicoccus albus]